MLVSILCFYGNWVTTKVGDLNIQTTAMAVGLGFNTKNSFDLVIKLFILESVFF
jgi:hypothetical protein